MRPIRSLLLAILLGGGLALSSPVIADTTYGDGIGQTQTVLVSELLAHPDAYVGKTVKVEGLITDVCAKRGCWIALASDKEFQEIRFKVEDGVIVFPQEAKGKRAVVEGTFVAYELTREQAIERGRHHAEETGEPFDESSITGPIMHYQIQGTGAVVK